MLGPALGVAARQLVEIDIEQPGNQFQLGQPLAIPVGAQVGRHQIHGRGAGDADQRRRGS